MTLIELNNYIKEIALSFPVVKDFSTDDVYESWNTGEKKYGAVNFNVTSVDNADGINQFNALVYYGDRLTDDRKNVEQVQSDAITILQGIVTALDHTDGISVSYTIGVQLFEQQFADLLAGGYVNLIIEAKGQGDCAFGSEVIFPDGPVGPGRPKKYVVPNGTKFGGSDFVDIENMDFSQVVDGAGLFRETHMKSVPPISLRNAKTLNSSFKFSKLTESPVLLNTGNAESMANIFEGCRYIKHIKSFDTHNVKDVSWAFCTHDSFMYEKPGTVTIDEFDFSSVEKCDWMLWNVFTYDNMWLKNLGGFKNMKVSFMLHNCPNLTHESLVNVINKLGVPKETQTLRLCQEQADKLTQEEIAVAISKNWTIYV